MAFYTDDQPDGKEKGASFREHFELASKVKPLIFERKIRSLDGRERICDVQLISLPSEKGGIMRASYTDITDRKRSEEALFLEKERYQSILKTAMDGFCLLDRDGRFLEVNDTYCMMCGYSSEELKNMTLYDVEAFEDKALLKQHVKTLLKQGKSRLETRHRHRNGHQVDVEVSVVYHPILGKGQFVAFIRDITERKVFESQRKNLEEQLHQAQKMEVLGTLAGGIAHDFNNILYPIIGFTEMLLENAPEEGDTRLSLEQILKASLRAADLVQQILAFSRQSEILRMPLRIQSVVRDSLKLMRASFPSTITIQSDIDKNCGMVMASPVHIHQIAMNLMTNAYHAMEENGGILSVTLSEIEITPEDPGKMELYPGRYVQYSVADTGHGIDRNILDRIFDPYFTTKAAGKGTGLGLSVVHGIVKSYGGGIRVKSEPGGGTVFDVLLPVMDPVEREGDVSKKTMDSKGGHEHILIVDDEDSILRMERRLLEQLGYRVTTRSDVVEALELFRSSSQRFDLVITDMTMPGMTGEKFAVELKQIRKDIPVILCTGFSSLISPEEAESLGVDCFLMKPVVKGDLIKTIRSLLDGS
jgi:PAS domain S-box-containing protein